jgi:hypothetical protein
MRVTHCHAISRLAGTHLASAHCSNSNHAQRHASTTTAVCWPHAWPCIHHYCCVLATCLAMHPPLLLCVGHMPGHASFCCFVSISLARVALRILRELSFHHHGSKQGAPLHAAPSSPLGLNHNRVNSSTLALASLHLLSPPPTSAWEWNEEKLAKREQQRLPWPVNAMTRALPMLEKPAEAFFFHDLQHIRENLRAGLTVGFVSVPLSISLGVVSGTQQKCLLNPRQSCNLVISMKGALSDPLTVVSSHFCPSLFFSSRFFFAHFFFVFFPSQMQLPSGRSGISGNTFNGYFNRDFWRIFWVYVWW